MKSGAHVREHLNSFVDVVPKYGTASELAGGVHEPDKGACDYDVRCHLFIEEQLHRVE
jgi:hypothetical protein